MSSFTAVVKSAGRVQTVSVDADGRSFSALGQRLHTFFGCLFLLDSAFLILCHITFDFFDALNSPFYAWLRNGAAAAEFLYFPTLLGAIFALRGTLKSRAKLVAGACLLLQVSAGLLLYVFGHGGFCPFGHALAFGPTLQAPEGSYAQALACLVPVIWISLIRAFQGLQSASTRELPALPPLASFLVAGLAAGCLYAFSARLRLITAGQPFSLPVAAFSIAAHLVIFLSFFVLVRGLRLIACRSSRPWLLEFTFRRLGIGVLLAVFIRKVVMALLAYNGGSGDWYAALFAFTAVLLSASLKLTASPAPQDEEPLSAEIRIRWLPRLVLVTAAFAVFYFFAVKYVSLDWEHLVGCATAILVWVVLLKAVRLPSNRAWPAKRLAGLSLAVAISGTGLALAAEKPAISDALTQYSNYDQSFFAIQQVTKPVVRDARYAAWYQFLTIHANIRRHVQAPMVPLAKELTPLGKGAPNIFIFVMDGLRRDYISAYNPDVTFTPAMGAFAKDSVVFDNAISNYAGTSLAASAIWSGFQQINEMFPQPVSQFNHLQQMLDVDHYDCYLSYNPIIDTLTRASQDHITDLSKDLARSDQQEFGKITRQLEQKLLHRQDSRPIFVYSQPANVHTLELAWGGSSMDVQHFPGFNDPYATATAQLDARFGEFIAFLKQQGLYDNSVIIVTADHGESLGEMGRVSHVSNLTPEVFRIPMIIHVPERMKSTLVWDTHHPVRLRDITPTLYYLVGHPLFSKRKLIGGPLFTHTVQEQDHTLPNHYFLMSSYLPVFGILSQDQKKLFYVDATLQRTYYYDLEHDPHALHNLVTEPIIKQYEPIIRQDLGTIDHFYNVSDLDL